MAPKSCHDALVKLRWPDGFVCPKCRRRVHADCKPRRLFQCRACRVQTSVRAGTIFHKSRTPLTKWFLAMPLITSAKNDIAALELSRQIDVKWDTAWLIKQKLLEVMFQRNSIYKLERDIQIDDADQGGETPAIPGQSGRAARGQGPFRHRRPDAQGAAGLHATAPRCGLHQGRDLALRDGQLRERLAGSATASAASTGSMTPA